MPGIGECRNVQANTDQPYRLMLFHPAFHTIGRQPHWLTSCSLPLLPHFFAPSRSPPSTSLTQQHLPALTYSSRTKHKSHKDSCPAAEVAGMNRSRHISHSCRSFRSLLERVQAQPPSCLRLRLQRRACSFHRRRMCRMGCFREVAEGGRNHNRRICRSYHSRPGLERVLLPA